MADLKEIALSAALNLFSTFIFLLAFAILRIQPVNDRVYFPKWYSKGVRGSPTRGGTFVNKFVNLDCNTYIRFLSWMRDALKMPEPELIDHAGLDSVVYLRIYLLGLKVLVPLAVLSLIVLVPVNWTGQILEHVKDKELTFSDIDKLSISNIPPGSKRLYAHTLMLYLFTFWTFYVLHEEYKTVSTMRLKYIASEERRPDQFTVLVRNIPPDPDESVSEHVEHFFCVNHPDHYLSHQVVYDANRLAEVVEKKKSLHNWLTYYKNKFERTSKRPITKTGLWGVCGNQVDAIDHYTHEIQKFTEKENEEREKVINDPKSIIPAAFVSFKSRWGTAVCAQTQQTSDPTVWLTEWAPEPRDVYWSNLAIPYVDLTIRRVIMAVAFFFLTFFFIIPITLVQSLANMDVLQRVLPFLKPLIDIPSIKSLIQGFLPGIALKIFLIVLPSILMGMAKIEGFRSRSYLERRAASTYYYFILVNMFVGNIITGSAIQQLTSFLTEPPTAIPKIIGVSIPMRATFFITYTMVDGWAGIAAEILRIVPLIIYHIKNTFLVKTERDREQAMDPGYVRFSISEPQIQFYFLLGFVYAVVTPILLPFIVVFFGFSYLVFRHQAINVYVQIYESGASFWPDVHRRFMMNVGLSQLLIMGLLSTKNFSISSPLLLPLPVLSIWFHIYCKGRFESAFVTFPLQDAIIKDTLERATEPNFNLRNYIKDAYVHPVFKEDELDKSSVDEEEDGPLVPTKRTPRMSNDPSDNNSDRAAA